MATLLVLVIFIAYIGLGVPDSLFGAAWPAIYVEFGLPLSAQSAVTILVSCGTITSSLLSGKLINRFGTGIVTAISTTITALALLGFTLSSNLLFLCLCAVPLGLGAGAIDVAQNNYVANHYNARIMSLLHCFYGVGVAVSPFLMSIGLQHLGWRMGYFLACLVQSSIAIITIIAIPVWKKVHPEQTLTVEEAKKRDVSIFKLAGIPAVRATWLIFVFSCGIESICTSWGSTFLVESKGVDPSIGARM
ncbi:MAG: MFS transporter, partial [Clostridia bacterium]|nr:MFS transporter [Clostridia bacterium]